MNKATKWVLTGCITLGLSTVSTLSMAEKPAWAGQGGKPSEQQREEHKQAMTSKDKAGGDRDDDLRDKGDLEGKTNDKSKNKSKKNKKDKKINSEEAGDGRQMASGAEYKEDNHPEKTVEQMKELERGSEAGLQSRESRRKWWNFWD
ncbi:MAG: hypothetical protein V7752_12625 [Halopseudomonas sp.]